jgi:hypothetical protein
MTSDAIIRVAAFVAAVALVGAPAVVGLLQKAKAWLRSHSVAAGVQEDATLTDMRLVLELAARLKANKCTAGVALCQQLLDVMLAGDSPKVK